MTLTVLTDEEIDILGLTQEEKARLDFLISAYRKEGLSEYVNLRTLVDLLLREREENKK